MSGNGNGLTKERVLEELKKIKYPGFSRDIVSFGVVKEVTVQNSVVVVNMSVITNDDTTGPQIEKDVRAALKAMPGVKDVKLSMNVQQANAARNIKSQGTGERAKYLENVSNKIAITSGKGGVGKSTVALNLAIAIAKQGKKVGLLDSDVYGPNLPMMAGVNAKPEVKDEKLVPFDVHHIKLMSLGFLLPEDTPLIWRGPLVAKAVEQLLRDVAWGDLDYFIIDMPPGTGDVQLSIAQLLDLSGAVIVTTPQDVALADAVKGVVMYQKVNVPVIGIIENMSNFVCPHCGRRTDIFGHGGGEKESKRLGVPFLGEIPLDVEIRIGGDTGRPIVEVNPDSPIAGVFFKLADRIIHSGVKEKTAGTPHVHV
ncbi:septum site-determining protein MinD [bacterium BMS3Abin05]|nr:septum site-determining protein MinD [bacterium BMS3Abin05]GBE28906.1 septum site-determining protein MinD [bacterium BMS3Bbin03]HDZ12694.1 MRP family ATP-binding protein [Bacteroidota bacterium]